jgi:hypothetical protein
MIAKLLHCFYLLELLCCISAFVSSSFPPTSRHTVSFVSPSESISNNTADKKMIMTFPTQEVLEKALSVAKDAGRKAGDIILGNTDGAEVTTRKANSRDLLTLMDPLCEKTIKEIVLATFPDHDFLGEEDVPPGKEASAAAINEKLENSKTDWLWIVDPIDGTTNFANGIP